jgi:hypothetical protein
MWLFRVTLGYEGLPDAVTATDIYSENISTVTDAVRMLAPSAHEKLLAAQRKLVSASSDADFSEVGNLCVQFWEDFTDEAWSRLFHGQQRPPKAETKNKILPIIRTYITSGTTKEVAESLEPLSHALTSLTQKTKHRSDRPERDAKLAVLLTAALAEEILYYFPVAASRQADES